MTVQEKELLRRALIAFWKLLRSENLTEAIEHIDELVEAADSLEKSDGNSSYKPGS